MCARSERKELTADGRTAAAPVVDPVKLRRRAALLLLVIATAAAALVHVFAVLLVLLRDLPGDVDALLLACPRCSATGEGTGVAHNSNDASVGFCDQRGGTNGDEVVIVGGWRDELVWRLIRRTLVPDCDDEIAETGGDDPCRTESEEEKLCRVCEEYQRLRSHVRIEKLTLAPGWWYRCEFRAQNVSLSSRGGVFIERGLPADSRLALYLPRSRDVLRFDVRDGVSDGSVVGAASLSPPPAAVEIGDVRVRWRSWKFPVVDTTVSDVTFNVVIGTNKSGALGVPVPVVTLGETLVDEVLDMLPEPPEREGTYPRIGIVNVANVTVLFHTAPDRSAASVGDHAEGQENVQSINCAEDEPGEPLEQKRKSQFAEATVPNEYFDALLGATMAASPAGIDQFHFNSVVLGALKSAIRQQLLREEDFRDFLDHLTEMSHALKKEGLGKLQNGAQFIDAFLLEGRAAFGRWWRDLRLHWKEKNNKSALQKAEARWEKFLNSIHFEPPKLARVLDDMAKSVEKFKNKSTDKKSFFPNIADEWKKGWAEMEQNWAEKVVPHIDTFLADAKDELKKLQGALKGEVKLAKDKN